MSSDLTTHYLGLELKSPIIVGSCPLTIEPELVRQLIDAGAGAVVLPSVLEEQIVYARMKYDDPLAAIEKSGYQPQHDKYNGGVENYLRTIRHLKANYPVPIFGSINGGISGDWIHYTKEIEDSGADGLEINWQPVVATPEQTADQVEEQLCEIVRRTRDLINIPIAVKLNQQFTNLSSIAHKLQNAGADGLVLFTHMPHWDVCIERMHWTIRWELSPVDSIGRILEGIVRTRTGGLDLSIAASGGVRSSEDAIKSMIAGADAAMVTSEIYREGPNAVHRIVEGIRWYLDTSPFRSLQELKSARPSVDFTSERRMRLEYVDPLTRSDHYIDPTPVPVREVGDAYGHKY
tara:strand:+ start:145822 stop:146865 length:1044 start_codon:yes stop_codon:yes gene_type:complete